MAALRWRADTLGDILTSIAADGRRGGGRGRGGGACRRAPGREQHAVAERRAQVDLLPAGGDQGLLARGVGAAGRGPRAGRGRGPELATVAVVGGEGQVGVEVALAQVHRPPGVFQHLRSRRHALGHQGVVMETAGLATLSRITTRGGARPRAPPPSRLAWGA